MTSVRIQQVTKRFSAGGAPAVSDVTFEASNGGITSLLGPSGAGKSTILRSIAGLEVPDSGRIIVDGTDITNLSVQARGVGFVFQGYALFQQMTIRDNVAFGLDLRKTPKGERNTRVDELLALVQLEGYADRYPSQLSGGQRQRVAFARALAIRPKVLLLDEPFGALDTRVRVELRDWLQRLHEETQVTTLLVTHDQEEALEVSQRVVVMLEGRVAQIGTPVEVYDAPANPGVATFLGASRLRGRVRAGRAEVGSFSESAPAHASDGDVVDAYVRSHDVSLKRPSHDAESVSLGSIVRFRPIGGMVKITLLLPGGDRVVVDMPRVDFEKLGLTEGDQVFVDVRAARVFYSDYAI